MSQSGSFQDIEGAPTSFALIALAVALAPLFADIFTLAVLATRMSCKVFVPRAHKVGRIDQSVHEEQIAEYPFAHH